MRRTTTALGVLGVALAAAPGAAQANHVRIQYGDTFTTRTPGAATGRTFSVDFFNAQDPNAKPAPLAHARYEMPPGSRFNTGALPRCTATDAQLMAQGASACEDGSRIGIGTVLIDSGFPEPNRTLTEDFTVFNAKDSVIALSQDRANGARVVLRGQVSERAIDLDVPPLPGTPPEGGANRSERFTYAAATGPGGAFLTTPPDCPADGAWVLRTIWTFRDGEQVTRESRTPCDARGGGAAAQRLTFFRRQRARAGRGGTLRVRAAAASRATVRISRGGQVLRRQSVTLRAGLNRIALPALGRGRYRLTVEAGGTTRAATLTVR
jgi:hypothetical protein